MLKSILCVMRRVSSFVEGTVGQSASRPMCLSIPCVSATDGTVWCVLGISGTCEVRGYL